VLDTLTKHAEDVEAELEEFPGHAKCAECAREAL